MMLLRLGLVLLRRIGVRRRTGMRRRAGVLCHRTRSRARRGRLMMRRRAGVLYHRTRGRARRGRLMMRRRHRRMLLRTAFVEPAFIAAVPAVGVDCLILAAPRIPHVILRRRRERTEPVIGRCFVVVRGVRVHAVAWTRAAPVDFRCVPTRLSR